MSLLTLLLIVLLIAAVMGAGPWYGWNRNWGYGPMGGIVGLILLVLLILFLTGHLGGVHVTTD